MTDDPEERARHARNERNALVWSAFSARNFGKSGTAWRDEQLPIWLPERERERTLDAIVELVWSGMLD